MANDAPDPDRREAAAARVRRAMQLGRPEPAATPAAPAATPSLRVVRKVSYPQRGPDGLCIQPRQDDAERRVYENKQRLRAMWQIAYADQTTANSVTYDPDGRYNCGRCNQAEGGRCLVIRSGETRNPIEVDAEAGSCRYWERVCAGDPEALMVYADIWLAAYAIAANGETWGCDHCPKSEPAFAVDDMGRALYCREIDARVDVHACCAVNGLETVPIGEDGRPVRTPAAAPAARRAMVPASRLARR